MTRAKVKQLVKPDGRCKVCAGPHRNDLIEPVKVIVEICGHRIETSHMNPIKALDEATDQLDALVMGRRICPARILLGR